MMTQRTSGRRRQRGLSLVEIMVALFVGLFLTAGILQIFAGTRQTYRFEEALSRIQENGRFALETIARDARMVGFGGCVSLNSMNPDLIMIEGQTVPDDNPPFQALPGTDLVTLRSLHGSGIPISAPTAADSIALASNPDNFAPNQQLAIADCAFRQIEIFTAQEITGTGAISIKPAPPLSRTYPADPERPTEPQVFRFREVAYFIRGGAGGAPALWRRVAPGNPEELVEGVHDMEVRYLIDNEYVLADADTDWATVNVQGVRISLLLASDDSNLTADPQSIEWRGDQETQPDTRLYQVFTTAVALRNQLN